MDIEKTIQFLLEHQARFDASLAAFQAKFEEDITALQKRQEATDRLINAFAKAGQAQIELHTSRMDAMEKRLEAQDKRLETQEREFQAFLGRFDEFLRGRRNGDRN